MGRVTQAAARPGAADRSPQRRAPTIIRLRYMAASPRPDSAFPMGQPAARNPESLRTENLAANSGSPSYHRITANLASVFLDRLVTRTSERNPEKTALRMRHHPIVSQSAHAPSDHPATGHTRHVDPKKGTQIHNTLSRLGAPGGRHTRHPPCPAPCARRTHRRAGRCADVCLAVIKGSATVGVGTRTEGWGR